MATAPKPKPKAKPKTVDQLRKPDGTYPKGTKVPGYAAQKGKMPKGPVTNKFSKTRPAKPDTRIAGRGR